MEPIHFENEEEPETQKKGLLAKFGIGNAINIVSVICMAAYLLGIHKMEMSDLTRSVDELKKTSSESASKLTRIDLEGPEFSRKLSTRVEDNERHLIRLDGASEWGKQKGSSIDSNLSSLDARIIRIENTIPQIALLQKDVQMLVESQTAIRSDIKELSKDIKELTSKIK